MGLNFKVSKIVIRFRNGWVLLKSKNREPLPDKNTQEVSKQIFIISWKVKHIYQPKTKVLPWYNHKHARWNVDGEKVIRKLPFEHKSHLQAAVFAWNIEKNNLELNDREVLHFNSIWKHPNCVTSVVKIIYEKCLLSIVFTLKKL